MREVAARVTGTVATSNQRQSGLFKRDQHRDPRQLIWMVSKHLLWSPQPGPWLECISICLWYEAPGCSLCVSIKSAGGNSSPRYTSLEPGIILSYPLSSLPQAPNLYLKANILLPHSRALQLPRSQSFSTPSPPTLHKLEFLLSDPHPFSRVALCEHTPQSTLQCICLGIRLPPSTPLDL